MTYTDRICLARAYSNAWIAVKGGACTVTADAAGWYTIKLTQGSTITSRRVRARELLAGLATLTGRLATAAKEAA